MTERRSFAEELITERLIEEFRENFYDVFQVISGKPEFRRAAAHAYIRLAEIWSLTQSEAALLLNVSIQNYRAWQAEQFAGLDADELEKISCLLGIYRYLFTLYSGHDDRVSAWLCRKNSGVLYGGSTPYDLLTGAPTNVFYSVRRHLAAATV